MRRSLLFALMGAIFLSALLAGTSHSPSEEVWIQRELESQASLRSLAESRPAWRPSQVRIEQQPDGTWRYLVNDQPEYFVGMGYNPVYRYLGDEERARRYHRDFRMLRDAGVNTLVLWTEEKGAIQDKYDQLTYDLAHAYGLGVIIPFFLPERGNYRDPTFRERLRETITETVIRYRDHPALRFWGLGNEVLLQLPRGQRASFSEVFIQLADLIHELDPNHPVIYREAEEQWVSGLRELFDRGGIDRPWLHFGMNMYTMRIEEVLDAWPTLWPDKPLIINEFGPPFDQDYPNRGQNYVAIWDAIRRRSDYVLGGAPYVWMAPGPDPYDGFYGLVGAETARPVDNTFELLAAEFRKIQQPAR